MIDKPFPKVGDFIKYGELKGEYEVVYVDPDNRFLVYIEYETTFKGHLVQIAYWLSSSWAIVEPLIERWALVSPEGDLGVWYRTADAAQKVHNTPSQRHKRLVHLREVREETTESGN